eukprot:CAMPEP_0173386984 /NCGR_PEP_ID=MMETSP1356-20130122/9534_1 /TAXON_ID=77927 ORGANISM="Hemiselmis virescens, Strain PCC157" /NCGR_SAMPLE_ID=MMETSP1356 /ASSEMBLY_ACC=CAM_ASM_000847 /LENGTH=255 /DNA_ID=CAMNT_0014343423 /DNA_START=43 /DNA_END=810 /DNA_ORIENTATION=-
MAGESEVTPLRGFNDAATHRPKNWKEADAEGWPEPTYQSEDVKMEMQRGFLKKVYSILCCQLAMTVAVCYAIMMHPAINSFVTHNSFIMLTCLFASLGLIVALNVYKNSYPTNMYLLAAFTFVESVTVGAVCAHYERHGVGELVGVAWGITLAIFCFLTLYVHISKKDFSFLGMFLPAALLGFCVFSLVSMLFGFHLGWFFAFGGACLFSAFIVYDTWMIMNRMGCDDYVIACIELYLDIINLFLMILQLLGNDR